jgi:hypothetical protein
MGLLTPTTSKTQFIPNNGSTVLTLDVCEDETHSRQATATKFPVENGQNVSDDIILEPFDLKITGVISDTPLSIIQSLVTAGVSHFLPPVGVVAAGAAYAIGSALSGTKSPSVQAYAQLLMLQGQKLPMSVLTTLRLYKNMWITSISVPRSAKNGNWLVFDIGFSQLILVSPQTVTIGKFQNADLSAQQAQLGKEDAASSQALSIFKQNYNATLSALGVPGS